jgi:ribosomal protein L7/L12
VLDRPPAPDLGVEARLITAPALPRPLPQEGGGTDFPGLAVTELTPFVVLRVEDARGAARETVVLGDLQGDVEGRVDSVLAKQLDSPEKFLAFLLLLLELPGFAPGGGGGGGGAGPAEKPAEVTEFNVVLEPGFDAAKKIGIIKVVREITALGLKEAKDLVEAAPKPVKEGVNKEEADAAAAKLRDAGATADVS